MAGKNKTKETAPHFSMEEVEELTWWQKLVRLVKQRRSWQIAILAALTVSTFLAVKEVQRRQEWRSKAAGEINVFLQPNQTEINSNSETELKVWVTSSKPVAFVDLQLAFDKTKVKLAREITLTTPQLNQIVKLSPPAEANANGTVKLTLGLDPSQRNNAPQQTFQVASIRLSANTNQSDQTSEITFGPMQVVSNDNNQAVELTGTTAGSTLNINPTSGDAKLFFSLPNPNNPQTVGTPFTAQILVNTGNQAVYGVDAKITFDRTKVRVDQVTPAGQTGFTSFPVATYSNTAGTITVSGNIGSGANANPVNGTNIPLATVRLTPLAAGQSALEYIFTPGDRNDSNVVAATTNPQQDPVDILAAVHNLTVDTGGSASPVPSPSASPVPSPSLTPSPTPGTTPSPSPIPEDITVRLLFQGRARPGVNNAKPLTLTYKYLSQAGSNPVTRNLTTSANGEATLSLLPGNYLFLIKGQGYLARRYGSTAQPLVINAGDQFLDLTGYPLLGGDFNNDGEINEIDYVTYFMPKFNTADAATDLDGSGNVNNLDFGVMRPNWNLVNDTL